MKFTPKSNAGAVISEVLAIAMVLLGISHSAKRTSVDPSQASLEIQGSPQAWDIAGVQITPAVDWSLIPAVQTARSEYYQPVTAWYKSKHWWKKNAPIIGGAAGGAAIGGLAGGGAGALIGGAIGGGGGYAYKRLKHHHSDHGYPNSDHKNYNQGYQGQHPNQPYHQ